MKIKYESFSERAQQMAAPVKYYYVWGVNDAGTEPRLLGIVRKSATGIWTGDGTVFPPRPTAVRERFRTRKEAARLLLSQHMERLQAKAVRREQASHMKSTGNRVGAGYGRTS